VIISKLSEILISHTRLYLFYWNIGILEEWNNGFTDVEYWNVGF